MYSSESIHSAAVAEIDFKIKETSEFGSNPSPWLCFQPLPAQSTHLLRKILRAYWPKIDGSEDALKLVLSNLAKEVVGSSAEAAQKFFFQHAKLHGKEEISFDRDSSSIPVFDLLSEGPTYRAIISSEAQQGLFYNGDVPEKHDWKKLRGQFWIDDKAPRFNKSAQVDFYMVDTLNRVMLNPDYITAPYEALAVLDPESFGAELKLNKVEVEKREDDWQISASIQIELQFDPSKKVQTYQFARCLKGLP